MENARLDAERVFSFDLLCQHAMVDLESPCPSLVEP